MRFTTTTILAAVVLAVTTAAPAAAQSPSRADSHPGNPGGHGLGQRSGIGLFGGPLGLGHTSPNPRNVEAGTGNLAQRTAPSLLGGAYGKTVTSRMQGAIRAELGPIPNPRPPLGKGIPTKVPGLNINPQPSRPGVDARLNRMGPSGYPDGHGREVDHTAGMSF